MAINTHYRRIYAKHTACGLPKEPGRFDAPHPVKRKGNNPTSMGVSCGACLMSNQFEEDTYLLEIGHDGNLYAFEKLFVFGEDSIEE